MSRPKKEEQWRWAEALAIEKLHGTAAPRFIAERIAALAQIGDYAGVERMREISEVFETMLAARRNVH